VASISKSRNLKISNAVNNILQLTQHLCYVNFYKKQNPLHNAKSFVDEKKKAPSLSHYKRIVVIVL